MIGSFDFPVRIECMTFNQSAYITDTLKGFVIQQTNFPYFALVVDDASTDGEQAVIQSYLDEHFYNSEESCYNEWETEDANWIFAKHKENDNCFFVVVFLKRNLYRDPRKQKLLDEWMAKAKYIAMCEGDDYWTDPLKLQKQVDFLEAHEDYSMCFTNSIAKGKDEKLAINHIWDTYTIEDIIQNNALNCRKRGDLIVPCAHTSTILYRRQDVLPDWISKCYIGDEPLFIALGQYGKAKLINEPMTVYRTGVGVSSKNFSHKADWISRIEMYKIINAGLGFKYRSIIDPIIAQLYFMLFKLSWKTHSKKEAVTYLVNSIRADWRIVGKWIKNKSVVFP